MNSTSCGPAILWLCLALCVLGGAGPMQGGEPTMTTNPELRVNELFTCYEDLRHPVFADLRKRYDIDAVVAGIDGEFARILALRHWIKAQIRIEDDNPTRTEHGTAQEILDAARAGGGFHCAHFRIVQQAVLNAYGHVTRSLGIGDGAQAQDQGRHHGVNEVWVNELCKWVVVDAKYDMHFEKGGMPLSALEIRDELLRNGAADVRRIFGPSRELNSADVTKSADQSMSFYRWLSWELNTGMTSDFPNHVSSALVTIEDDYSRNNVWYRNGKPHWAYEAKFFIPVARRSWIEWTPNVVRCDLRRQGDRASISLATCTPNFARFLMRQGSGEWRPCGDRVVMPVAAADLELSFCSENLAGVRGPTAVVRLPVTAP
jgi:hypothetical protein